jgi:hypothetical protein
LSEGMICGSSAQKIDTSKVPGAVKAMFGKQFPGAVAEWEKQNGNYEAGFKQAGHQMSALSDANGNMKESETKINRSELPISWYEAEVSKMDILFDVVGNFIKELR